MPLPKVSHQKPQATAKDVKSAAAVGDAAFAYFKKHGSFPTSKEQLAKG
jgi:DNA-binding transcriptional regulator LsrR (DeoR family)